MCLACLFSGATALIAAITGSASIGGLFALVRNRARKRNKAREQFLIEERKEK